MADSADVIAEMSALGIGTVDSGDEVDGLDEVDSFYREELAKHRQTIVQISNVADKMSGVVHEIRNMARETDDCLRKLERDLEMLSNDG